MAATTADRDRGRSAFCQHDLQPVISPSSRISANESDAAAQDGVVLIENLPGSTRHYAPADARNTTGWVEVARYVFIPTRDKAKCRYRYTGTDQQRGPVAPLDDEHPDWS